MQYMTCNRCRKVVQVNNTGICMGCQLGMAAPLDEESYQEKSDNNTHHQRNNCGIITQKEENELERQLDQLKQRRDEVVTSLRQFQEDAKLRLKKEKKNATKKRKK